ncbi:RNA polymerase sigma factor [Patescibacteria group bacterium]|nr:RNA polymerase sigma factor [Patescibacteria group bacterium]
MSEKDLVEAAKKDKAKFLALYDLHFDAIYRYLLSRVSDVQLAEDLTSDTFSIALEKIDRYEWTGKPFRSWLYRIAINEMNQYFRKQKKERATIEKEWHKVNETFDFADAELKDAEDREAEASKLKELNLAFRSLKKEDQDLLSLKFFEDLSYKEIAEVLNISVNNVGVRLIRAQNRLTKLCNFSLS